MGGTDGGAPTAEAPTMITAADVYAANSCAGSYLKILLFYTRYAEKKYKRPAMRIKPT